MFRDIIYVGILCILYFICVLRRKCLLGKKGVCVEFGVIVDNHTIYTGTLHVYKQ